MEIGMIGLGAMGREMARNLVAAGHTVTAWNRSGGQIAGVRIVETAKQAMQGDIALTMLSDDAAIRSVLLDSGELFEARPGLVHGVASTISVAFAEELTALHRAANLGYVAAPVLGRPDVAARGELNVLAAGMPDALATIMPALEVIGKRVWLHRQHAASAFRGFGCKAQVLQSKYRLEAGLIFGLPPYMAGWWRPSTRAWETRIGQPLQRWQSPPLTRWESCVRYRACSLAWMDRAQRPVRKPSRLQFPNVNRACEPQTARHPSSAIDRTRANTRG